jgi:hypothetical protein
MNIPPRDVMAAAARNAVKQHDRWDGLHVFETLSWDGEKLGGGIYAAIDPGFEIGAYPKIMRKIAVQQLTDCPGEPACAYLLMMEAYSVETPADATPAQRRQNREDVPLWVRVTEAAEAEGVSASEYVTGMLHERIFTCDMPRLEAYLPEEARRENAEMMGSEWRSPS